MAASFFIRHDQKIHWQRSGSCCTQVAQRRQGQVNTGLHVVTSGAIQAVTLYAAGIVLQRPERVNRVGVSQNQQARPVVALCAVADVKQRS